MLTINPNRDCLRPTTSNLTSDSEQSVHPISVSHPAPLELTPPPSGQAARAWFNEHTNDQAFDWEEAKVVDPKVYAQLGKDGLLVCLAFGARIPKEYAKPDGTVFGGVKVEEWDGFHDYVSPLLGAAGMRGAS